MTFHTEIKDHLKKLRQIKKELKKDPIGTPLRKKDRIDVKHKVSPKGRKNKK